MTLDTETLLGIQVDIKDTEPILQRVTNADMIKYLTDRGFSHAVTHDTGLAAYTHSEIMVHDGDTRYPLGTTIDTNNDSNARWHPGNVKQFLYDMQRFHRLKSGTEVSQLRILYDLCRTEE